MECGVAHGMACGIAGTWNGMRNDILNQIPRYFRFVSQVTDSFSKNLEMQTLNIHIHFFVIQTIDFKVFRKRGNDI